MDDLLVEFLTETQESLAELDLALVRLERNPDDEPTLSQIFRLVHTIKGTCGFLGLPRLERVAHAAENVLGRVRDGALQVTPGMISLVLAGLDRIKLIVAGLAASGTEPEGDDAALIARLDAAAAGEAPAADPSPRSVPESAEPAASASGSASPPRSRPEAQPGPAPGSVPEVRREPAAEPAREPALEMGREMGAEPIAGPQTIRVSVDVLEELMTLVGELVLTRNQLLQLSRAQGTTAFSAPLQRLSHIATDLQEGVMKTRMQPIGNAWNKLPRLVRDLAAETGKLITLEMRGQETELDRQVLELIRDPLTHMVRNSADHGLEPPEARRAAGKPETGHVRLNAYHEGGHIIIEVSDDGRGLDAARIRAKALAQGLASEAELAAMTDAQVHGFIFRAGFSTAAAVTAISGRGVGMDVVRTNIERIGGTIELSSTQGLGTRFTIKIPLTLAIVSALIVRAGSERFAIPQIAVQELVRLGGAEQRADGPAMTIERINETPVLRLRDRLLPLVDLAGLLRLGDAGAAEGGTVVVIAVGSSLLGLIVEEVFDTEEIVVKPVAPILRHVTMFSGNTILGDGSVVMILDPNGIARGAGIGLGGERRIEEAAASRLDSDRLALLLFRAGGEPAPKIVPLSLVARLERIPRERIEQSAGGFVTQYRGQLMPLVAMGDAGPGGANRGAAEDAAGADGDGQPVLVFTDAGRSMGLMVDAILDVVHDRLQVQLSTARPGLLGTAVVAGQAADVLDTTYWLTACWRDWFGTATGARKRVLVVDDSDFFRQLLTPTLAAAGYEVTAAPDAAAALALRDGGMMVDAVISDIEMPGMDGLEFARQVRAGGRWADLPLIALTGRNQPKDEDAGREAGFTDYVPKFERQALLDSLRQCLAADAA